MMTKMLAGLTLLCTTSAAFAIAQPKGNGDLDRAAVLKLVGAKSDSARVVGLNTSARKVKGLKLPTNARLSGVQYSVKVQGKDQVKVSFVKIPLSRGAATEIAPKDLGRYGIMTPRAALAKIDKERGTIYGKANPRMVTFAGFSRSGGSYRFIEQQIDPATKKPITSSTVRRSIAITGDAETAGWGPAVK